MGVNKKTDGRYIVGMGAPNENEYKGSMGWRDIFIQLTENGATPDSEEKLAFLRDYAIYHNGEGNAIMPPSVSVWVSNNGVTSAVNADDITLEDGTYTICGIKWDGTSWDYSNAGQSSGGGGSSLPSYTSADVGKVLTVEALPETITIAAEQTFTVANGYGQMTIDFTPLSVGDHAQVEGTVSGQTISIDMVVVEHEGKLYLIDALYSEYDPTHGYVSEDGVFYYPAMAQVPSVDLSGRITTVKTEDPVLEWSPIIRVIRATGVGIADKQANTVVVPLDISWDEWHSLFKPETFRPAVIYTPKPDLYVAPYWTYENGGYTLWLRDDMDGFERVTVEQNTKINFYMGDVPSIVYTVGGAK